MQIKSTYLKTFILVHQGGGRQAVGVQGPALLPDRTDADLHRLPHLGAAGPEERECQSEGTVHRYHRQQDGEWHPPGPHRGQGPADVQGLV